MFSVLLYNKINLGGIPMKRRTRVDLALTIVTAVFFIAAVALFFLLPVIDNAIAENPSGVGYYPVTLAVDGALALITFNFASIRYLTVFIAGCVVGVFFLFWLIALIVKKQPKKLIFWFIFLIMAAACGIMASGFIIASCREVTLMSGAKLKQYLVNDLLNMYSSYRVAEDVAPFILYNFITWILGYVTVGLIALTGLFCILTPFVSGINCFRKEKVRKAKPAKAVEEKPAEEEEVDEEELARQKAEARLISYVEYKAGISARNKEYEELCRANGIPLPGDEDDEEAYYNDVAARLSCLHEEPVEEDDDEYYRVTAAQLGCLQPQPEPAPVVDDDEEYYKRMSKELAVFRYTKARQEADDERYYASLIKELDALNGGKEDPKKEVAISNLKRSAAAKRAYYERLAKELPCLQFQKDPVEPEVSDDED